MAENIEELWIKLENKLKIFIISKIHNETIANDILQDVFIKIHSNIDKLENETKIQSWIYQITRNLIIDYFRETKKEDKKLQYKYDDKEDSLSDNFMQEIILDMIMMMDDLSPEYCEAICLTELEGMSQKAYAEKIGISYSGAKSRVQRARNLLKDELNKCCHFNFDKYGTILNYHPITCCCCEKCEDS